MLRRIAITKQGMPKPYIVPFVVHAIANASGLRAAVLALGVTPSHVHCESLPPSANCKVRPSHDTYAATCRKLLKLETDLAANVDCDGTFTTYF